MVDAPAESPSAPLHPTFASWEIVAYLVVIGLAVVLRFWDLGSRAMHHDESLHTTYSWYILWRHGYQHDPMMHGPLQYFLRAFTFLVLGVSDYTSRVLWPAFLW